MCIKEPTAVLGEAKVTFSTEATFMIEKLEAERDSAIRDAKRWEDEAHRQHDKFIASENEHLKNEAERDQCWKAGHILAMRLLQSNIVVDEDEEASIEVFVTKNPETFC